MFDADGVTREFFFQVQFLQQFIKAQGGREIATQMLVNVKSLEDKHALIPLYQLDHAGDRDLMAQSGFIQRFLADRV